MSKGVSEFAGRDATTGLPDKPVDALSASEKLRLGYTTGVEDPNAPLDRSAWLGEMPGSEPE
jgi:hypothetical protein